MTEKGILDHSHYDIYISRFGVHTHNIVINDDDKLVSIPTIQ